MGNKNILALLSVFSSVLMTACVPDDFVFSMDGSEPPTLIQITPVATPSNDTTPEYTFYTSQKGIILYNGDCSSSTILAVEGNNTITFNTLSSGLHSNCTVNVIGQGYDLSHPLIVESFTIVKTRFLNDTGITLCGDYAYVPSYSGEHSNSVNCMMTGADQYVEGVEVSGDPVSAGQDAVYGRDSNVETNSDSDGYKGFSFTRIAADGSPLGIQDGIWNDAGNEQDGTRWSCIKDNVTGLMWEVKTNDGGLHDKDWTYTWYHANDSKNGGYAGTEDTGLDALSDNCVDGVSCDTQQFVIAVNTEGLCGSNDWYMPTSEELLSIVTKDHVNPTVDVNFFPNTMNVKYWSLLPYAGNSSLAWLVNFGDGSEHVDVKSNSYYVRLVRGN